MSFHQLKNSNGFATRPAQTGDHTRNDITDRKEKKRPWEWNGITPRQRTLLIQEMSGLFGVSPRIVQKQIRESNPPVGSVPENEIESLRAVILRHAPREYQRLCRAGCDPDWLIVSIYAWAWWPDKLLRGLQKQDEEGGLSWRQERDKMMRIARGLEQKAVKMKYAYHRSASFAAANCLRAEAKHTLSSFLLAHKPKEQSLRGDAERYFVEWVKLHTNGRRFIGTAAKLLEVAATHYNKQDSSLQIYPPTKASIQAVLRRHRHTSA